MGSVVTITAELPPETVQVIKNLQELPDEIPKSIKRGMDRALSVVRGRIQTTRLSGLGPFPPDQHRLGEVSGTLRGSLVEVPAEITGGDPAVITGGIQVPESVIYGRVHEFGMSIYPKNGPFLVFRIPPLTGKVYFAKKVTIPARATITTGVTENLPFIQEEISQEIVKSLNVVSK